MTLIEIGRRAQPDEIHAASEHPPLSEGVFNSESPLLTRAYNIGQSAVQGFREQIGKARTSAHELVHGEYSHKFKSEFKQRTPFETTDGVKLTARILNPEFLNNDEHSIIYFYSLSVPAEHGAELPTVADIAAHGEQNGRSVIAITTDGLAGPQGWEQLVGLADFWKMPKRRFEFLRELLPKDKKIIVTGSSLGGMMSHAMAATWQEEAQTSDYPIEVTHDIAIASAAHHEYSLKDYPTLAKQFIIQESRAGINYVLTGKTLKEKIQRSFELAGTVPKHPTQLASIAFISLGVMKAPLKGVEFRIPHSTKVIDATFDRDGVTHPRRRGQTWAETGHPDISHYDELGPHLELLTRGREITLTELAKIPSKFKTRQLAGF